MKRKTAGFLVSMAAGVALAFGSVANATTLTEYDAMTTEQQDLLQKNTIRQIYQNASKKNAEWGQCIIDQLSVRVNGLPQTLIDLGGKILKVPETDRSTSQVEHVIANHFIDLCIPDRNLRGQRP